MFIAELKSGGPKGCDPSTVPGRVTMEDLWWEQCVVSRNVNLEVADTDAEENDSLWLVQLAVEDADPSGVQSAVRSEATRRRYGREYMSSQFAVGRWTRSVRKMLQ